MCVCICIHHTCTCMNVNTYVQNFDIYYALAQNKKPLSLSICVQLCTNIHTYIHAYTKQSDQDALAEGKTPFLYSVYMYTHARVRPYMNRVSEMPS